MVPTAPGNGNRTPNTAVTCKGPPSTVREARCGAPLHSKLALLVTIIPGQPSKMQAYQQQLQPSFVIPGEKETSSNMMAHCDDGESFVAHGKSIPLLLLVW